MNRPFLHEPTDRFTGLADNYARYRPGYPTAALDFIIERCRLGRGSSLVDVGCGTGICSRLFAHRCVPVIGIEPNADMRARANRESLPPNLPAPCYREGSAEATGLVDGVADAVLAAQAFHWFAPEAALREFHRILKPAGWIVLLWNERDEADPCTAAYGAIVRRSPEGQAAEAQRAGAAEPLLRSMLFRNAERTLFYNEQTLEEAALLGRAFSVSYAPRDPAQAEALAAALRDVFVRHQLNGKVILRYETAVYTAQRCAGDR